MTDPEDNNYYSRKQRKADETAWLFMKITFYIMLFGLGSSLGIFLKGLTG